MLMDFDTLEQSASFRHFKRRKRKKMFTAFLWLSLAVTTVFTVAMCGHPARADDLNVTIGTQGYSASGPGGAIIVAPLGSSAPHIIHVPPGTFPVNPIHDVRWLARCRPHLEMGKLGVQHYVYAKPGCEYGADRDESFVEELPKD